MIENFIKPGEHTGYLQLTPEPSLSWRGNIQVLVGFTLLLTGISYFFASRGLWLIAPFAGAEILVLILALYLTRLAQTQREVIVFTESEVLVQHGRQRIQSEVRLPRYGSHFVVRGGINAWHPPRVLLRCRGQEIELAARFSTLEKEKLIAQLREITAKFAS